MVFPRFNNVAIVALARDEAPDIMTSADIESWLAPAMRRLKLPHGLLASLTGIKQRRLYPADYMPSQAAAAAVEKLFAKSQVSREAVDILYSTSVCRDHIEPSTASIVQNRTGLGAKVKSLDIGSACLGFIDGMELAAISIESGLSDYALIVAGENSRPILNRTCEIILSPDGDRAMFFRNFATLTLGSGGTAMLLGRRDKHPGSPYLVASVSQSDACSNHLCRGDAEGMETDSAALLNAGVALALRTFNLGKENFGWKPDSFARLISHQVSASNTKKLCETLGLDEGILVKTFPEYGNMGPAAVPFTLDLADEQGLIKPGDRLCLMGIGSGLCCSMMEVVW